MKLTPALCQLGVVGLTILFSEFRQGTGAEMRPVVLGSSLGRCRSAIRESSVKQQRRRRRRLRKRHLEVNLRCLKFSRAYSISSNIGKFFLELSSRGLYRSSGKEKGKLLPCVPVLDGKHKRHVVVVQRRQRNVQKSVMHVQSCCLPI